MKRRPGFLDLAILSLLILVAFAVRAISLDAQSLWRDEVDALRFATAPWSEMLSNFIRPNWNGPLYFLLLRAWIALVGISEYALRFFSLIFGVLCLPLIYVLGRRLFGRVSGRRRPFLEGRLGRRGRPFPEGRLVGLCAALLVACSPYLTWYGQEVKMYTFVPALALLAIYGLRRALEDGKMRWWVVFVVASTLAFYSHILAALLIPVCALLLVVWWSHTRKRWVGVLLSLACLTLPYLLLARWQIPLTLKSRETGFYPYTLHQMVEILFNGWSLGIPGLGRPWGTALMVALAAGGLISLVIPRAREEGVFRWEALSEACPTWMKLRLDRPPARQGRAGLETCLAMVCWLVTPLSVVWLISLRQPIFTDRYLIWVAPAFYLLVAQALVSLWSLGDFGRWVVGLLLSTILTLNGVNLWHQATVPVKSDFRAAAAYIADYRDPVAPAGSTASRTDDADDADIADIDRTSDRTSGAEAFRCYLPLVLEDRTLIVFQIPYGRYTFDYYFGRANGRLNNVRDVRPRRDYAWAEGLYTNHRAPDGSYLMSQRDAAVRLREMTSGYDVIWLVATETAMWDQRGLVQAWLEDNAQRVDEAHFAQVDVYRYTK